MDKYTKKDIIFYTKDLNVDELIGKECYFSCSADCLLDKANEDRESQKLVGVDKNSFISECNYKWTYIIVKKTQYVPFANAREFVEEYMANRTKRISKDKFTDFDRVGGMWLTIDGIDEYLSVTDISDEGITVGVNVLKNWDCIFRNYKFLDDSCCGKKVGN